jgi:peptidoglycan lytic transglycosylase
MIRRLPIASAIFLILGCIFLFPSVSLAAKKRHARQRRPVWHERQKIREERPEPAVLRPAPDDGSPGWDFWKSVLQARDRLDQDDARGALDLLSHLPPPPAEVLNKNQTFYRGLYHAALETGRSAAQRLSEPTEEWERKLWAFFPDWPDLRDPSADAVPDGATAADKITRLHILSQKSLFESATGFLSPDEIVGAELPAAQRCRALFEYGWALQKSGSKAEAIPVYGLVGNVGCEDKILARSLYWKGMLEMEPKQGGAAEETFRRLIREAGDRKYADDAYYQLSKIYESQNQEDQAERALQDLADLPEGDMKEKYLWDEAFSAYQDQDYEKASGLLDRIVATHPLGTEAQPQALYWKGRIEEIRSNKKLGGASAAEYRRILKSYPFSFYAILAEARLGESASPQPLVKAKGSLPSDKTLSAALRVVDELNRKGDQEEAADVLDYLTQLHPEIAQALPEAVAARWEQSGDYNRTLELAAERLGRSAFDIDLNRDNPLTRSLYPLAYPEEAKQASKDNRLPLSLIEAIMREESLFLRGVRSRAGAVGVMQLMPATARLKARHLGKAITTGDLEVPASNIELGSSFLGELMDRFGGQTALAVMAYNAGAGNVSKWLASQGNLPFDEFIELIPFTETRGYVKRVLRSEAIYAHLLGDRKAARPIKSLDPPQS